MSQSTHPSNYITYRNKDINQIFHLVRNASPKPFTIGDIDLYIEQNRRFKGLIEVKDGQHDEWKMQQYISYREMANALQLPFVMVLNRVKVHQHYRLYAVPTDIYQREPIPLAPHLIEEGGPELIAAALYEVLFEG